MNNHPLQSIKVLIAGLLLATGCQPSPTATSFTPVAPSHTAITLPTETSIPLAALVNDEPITLEEYESELARYHDARGIDLATDSEGLDVVIRSMIEHLLLVQGARSSSLKLGENDFQMELEELITDMGGQESYQQWLGDNHYNTETFEYALMNDLLAAKMVEKIRSDVPQSELQANARHILVDSQEEADRIRNEILAGVDFQELAVLYSRDLSTRPAGGDLGWIARGTLTMPSVEEAIFQLEPGEISDVIPSELGYHIVQLISLEERPLPYSTLVKRQQQAVEEWIDKNWEQAQIEIFITP